MTTNGQECAQIGANILAKNGSAVDAAIAALLCEGIASLHRYINLSFSTPFFSLSLFFLRGKRFSLQQAYFHSTLQIKCTLSIFLYSFGSMGLGGGFLMTIWDAKRKEAAFLDARETAPMAATEKMFDGNAHLAMYGRILLR